jgi:hypothetical protein
MNDGDFLSNVREEENLLFVGKSYRDSKINKKNISNILYFNVGP